MFQILVNERQRGNPMLREMRNVPHVFAKILPDYIVGAEACVMFISVKYHILKPLYLPRRLAELRGGSWRLRVLLCLVDADDFERSIHELNVLAVRDEWTLVLAHSVREAARLVECFKAYEHTKASTIRERIDADHLSKLTDALTTAKPVNKTDVMTLGRTFGSLADIITADAKDLTDCPGLGDKKVAALLDVFEQPFSLAARAARSRRQQDNKASSSIGAGDDAFPQSIGQEKSTTRRRPPDVPEEGDSEDDGGAAPELF